MKLILPPICVEEFEGFNPEKDIFNRKRFGEQLTNLVKNVEHELVIALDAPWGEGKTTFVKMWKGMLHENQIKSIYFDAFENDFHEDPFFSISGEIYELIECNRSDRKDEFKDKAISAIKTLGRASLRIGIKAATAGVLDDTVFDDTNTIKDVSKETSEIVDNYVSERLESVKNDKNALEDFRSFMEKVANEIGNDKPTIFIIDELDRCKPTFAIELLERIKHLFSVPKLVFVLVMNRNQLEELVRYQYGSGLDAARYLQKFVHIWTTLPKNKEPRRSDGKKYLSDCLSRMEFEIRSIQQQSAIELYEELVMYFNLSLREIERSLTNYSIINNAVGDNLIQDHRALSVFLSIIKVTHPATYRKLLENEISYDELVNETNLQKLRKSWQEDKPEYHPLKWLLKYHLSNDDNELKEMREKGNYSEDRRRQAINDVCSWLESFQRL
ncbi:MAG: hypothetical protein GY795_36650 [Desulfobacterales bacterium]|nr:hypothetical protein [Desulfobacterales bacterium]